MKSEIAVITRQLYLVALAHNARLSTELECSNNDDSLIRSHLVSMAFVRLSTDLIFLISRYSNQLILANAPDIFLLLLNTNTTCNWFLSLYVAVLCYTGYSITSNCPAENINQSNFDTWDFVWKLLCRANLIRRRSNRQCKSRHFYH